MAKKLILILDNVNLKTMIGKEKQSIIHIMGRKSLRAQGAIGALMIINDNDKKEL